MKLVQNSKLRLWSFAIQMGKISRIDSWKNAVTFDFVFLKTRRSGMTLAALCQQIHFVEAKSITIGLLVLLGRMQEGC